MSNSSGLTEYQVLLKDPTGTLLGVVDNFNSLVYSRAVNNVGTLTLTMPFKSDVGYSAPEYARFMIEGRIEVQRSIQGGQLRTDGETFYLIRRRRRILNDGQYLFEITAMDTMEILKRRYITPDPNAVAAKITAVAADDALKTIFTNNFLTGTGRDLTAAGVSVQANFTAAPVQTKQFQGRQVLTVMQEICASAAASASNPIYLAFDLVWTGNGLEFRTYTGQRGSDRRQTSGNPLVIGPDFGNMATIEADEDHTNEITHIYGGLTGSASDAARAGAGPFGRIEKYYATQGNSTTEQNNEAAGQLRLARPRYIHAGTLVQTDGFRYGLHYGYGDYLTTQFAGVSSDCRLDGISISVQDGEELVGGVLRSEI